MQLHQVTRYPLLLAAFDIWRDKRREGRMPHHEDLRVERNMPGFLPLTTEVVIEQDGRSFRCIRMGAEIVRRIGRDATGLTLEDMLSGSYLHYTRRVYTEVHRNGVPFLFESLLGTERITQRLMLPLATDRASPGLILIVQIFSLDTAPGRALDRSAAMEHRHFSLD